MKVPEGSPALAAGQFSEAANRWSLQIIFMKCPICGKKIIWQENPFRPFCSERCKIIDLGKWASGEYSLPGEDVAASDAGAETKPEE
jgi:endogenous inhibitor of DNA gyrase (YacG/DUF329 family)